MQRSINLNKSLLKDVLVKHNTLLMIIVLTVVSTLLSDVFLTHRNIFNILRQNTPLLLVSLGMLLVILTGGIDLSVGSIIAVGNMISAMIIAGSAFDGSAGLPATLVLTLALGFGLGGITGALVSFCRMAPFVASLAMMTMARGLAYLLTNGQPVRLPMDRTASVILAEFGSGSLPVLGIPWPVLLGAATVIGFYFIMKYTVFGRLITAIGSNEAAVTLAGVTVSKYKFFAYTISGMLSALAGILSTARSNVGTPVTGATFELDAIAACVIGGASLSGGKGSVINTLLGVLALGLISNIMNLLSVPSYPQQIIKGAIIIAAVFIQVLDAKK